MTTGDPSTPLHPYPLRLVHRTSVDMGRPSPPPKVSARPDLTTSAHNRTPPNHPSIAVIIPACNEEKNISACLSSLLQQDYAALHLIAVDDRSTDNTGAIINALATSAPQQTHRTSYHRTPHRLARRKNPRHGLRARHAISLHHPTISSSPDADILFHPRPSASRSPKPSPPRPTTSSSLPTTLIKSAGGGHAPQLPSSHEPLGRPHPGASPTQSSPRRRRSRRVQLIRTPVYQQLGGFEACLDAA